MSDELNLNTTPELTFEPSAAQAVEAPALTLEPSAPAERTASIIRRAPRRLSSTVPFIKSALPPIKALARSAPWRMAAERKSWWISMTAWAWAAVFTLKAPWAKPKRWVASSRGRRGIIGMFAPPLHNFCIFCANNLCYLVALKRKIRYNRDIKSRSFAYIAD